MEIEGGLPVLPFYIVCDEGSSMTDDAIAAVNAGIGELFRTIHGDPVVDAKARVGIIAFNDQANVLLPLTELSQVTQSPGCIRSVNPSSYKNVFHLLKAQIETDVLSLGVEGFRVHRPFVFFITCGKPVVEDWRYSLKQLTDTKFRFHPNIVSFGVAGADPSVIKEVSTPLTVGAGKKQSFAFLAQDGVNPGSALLEIMKFFEPPDMAPGWPEGGLSIDIDSLAPPRLDSIGQKAIVPKEWSKFHNLGGIMTDTGTVAGGETEGGVAVLPFYVVCDESSSMIGESIEAVNAGIGELFRTIHGDPVVDAKARVGIITFNDQANVLLPLTQLSLITQSPGCVASGSTSYASVFNLLKKQIETDIPRLKSEGFRVHRPMVFFMSDGQPNAEDWQSPLAQLTDANFHFHPNIVSFGVAGAEPSVIKEVSTPLTVGAGKKQSFAFLAQDGVNPGSALREIMKFITGTIIASARQDQPTMAIDKDQLADMGVLIIDSV